MRPERAQALKRGLPARSTAAPARRKGLVVGDGHISLTHRSEGTEPMAMSASTGLRTAGARTAEALRLEEIHRGVHWRRWGPYLSERQWGTVREDYSEHGDAWEFFPHDHARSRAYRWGEDGIGGFGDDHLLLCLGLALWNGRDPIMKERLFGLTNAEGNHGEDVKELYYYLDGTPTHSYMRMLYKYPQAAFPYAWLVEENRRRGIDAPEFEVIDTGVFDNGRYFDVTVEYAKAAPDDILMRVTVQNRAAEEAMLHVLPSLWARNTWSWTPHAIRPLLRALPDGSVDARRDGGRHFRLQVDHPADLLFCENETNTRRLYGSNDPGFFKDGINDFVVHGNADAVNRLREGTKCAVLSKHVLPAGGAAILRLRLRPADATGDAFDNFDAVFAARLRDADEFYGVLQRDIADADARLVQRQALAGMLWTKQF